MVIFARMYKDDQQLNGYLEQTCDPEPTMLQQISRETYLKETKAHMLSGHFQGRMLSLLSKLVAPKQILEIGTFTGYATLCLAEGLQEDGIVHTIEIDEELQDRIQSYFDDSAYRDRIQLHIGNAVEIIPQLSGDFDLVFIDADKKANKTYYDMVIERVSSGGLILVDNVLWKGKIFDECPDAQTKYIIELNKYLSADTRVEKLILPIRDGLFVLRKK